MNKTFWIGVVVLILVAQLIGYLVHGLWLDSTYTALADAFRPKEQMDSLMPVMMLTGIGVVFLFCYIFTKGHEGKGIAEGVRYGAIMGTLIGLPSAVDAYVIYPITSNLAAIWFVSGIITFAILGAIFAAIYKPS